MQYDGVDFEYPRDLYLLATLCKKTNRDLFRLVAFLESPPGSIANEIQ
jgi:hypothetical protein